MAVSHLKYFGIIIDSNLSFKKQVKNVFNTVQYYLANFTCIRNQMSTEAALLYMHSMILYHLSDWDTSSVECNYSETFTHIAQTNITNTGQKNNNKDIIRKHNLFFFDSFLSFANACLIYKIMNNLAPPPLQQFVQLSQLEQ